MDTHINEHEDMSIVAMWLRFNPTRWAAGAASGLFAAAVALCAGGALSVANGMEFWFPVKVFALIPLGPAATEYGSGGGALLAGLVVFGLLAAFLGAVYAHFTGTNRFAALLPLGAVWGMFSWIFIWNLYLQAVHAIFAMHVNRGAALVFCIVFGVSLASVSLFDRVLGASRR